MLNLVYTQNIDSLELKAGVNEHQIVHAHGNRKNAICSQCRKIYPIDEFMSHLKSKTIMYCSDCHSPCKTSVVFFGEPLPEDYFKNKDRLIRSDLVFIIGTSLVVKPFGHLIHMFSNNTSKIFINKESNIHLKEKFFSSGNYTELIGESDIIIKELIANLEWGNEYNKVLRV